VPIGAAVARQFGVAHFRHLQELYSTDHPVAYDCGWHLYRQLMRAPHNRLVGNSDAVRTHFAELLDRHDIATIYEGFDFPPLPRVTGDERYRSRIINAPVIELASVGVLADGKGQDEAILAIADLVQRGHRVHLSIAGEGDPAFTRYLHELTSRHRLEQSVTFLGFIPDPGVLYEQAAITLVCARAEGFGRAAVESSSRGTPVIGTDAGGLPEMTAFTSRVDPDGLGTSVAGGWYDGTVKISTRNRKRSCKEA
jgi:glycosyltransferase involved in cell wall biosynthesis